MINIDNNNINSFIDSLFNVKDSGYIAVDGDKFIVVDDRSQKNLKTADIEQLSQKCFEQIKENYELLVKLESSLKAYHARLQTAIENRWWYCIARCLGCLFKVPKLLQDLLIQLSAQQESLDKQQLKSIQDRFDNWEEGLEKEEKAREKLYTFNDALTLGLCLNFPHNGPDLPGVKVSVAIKEKSKEPLPAEYNSQIHDAVVFYHETKCLFEICKSLKFDLTDPNIKTLNKDRITYKEVVLARTTLNAIIKVSAENITKLELNAFMVELFPDEINLFQNLTSISIKNARGIKKFAPLKLPKLESMTLTTLTQLKEFPDLSNCPQLKEVNITNSGISRWPQKNVLPESIQVLNVSRNQFDELPRWIGELKNLICIDASGTRILRFPRSFYTLPNLHTLLWTGLNIDIRKLPDFFVLMPSLKKVDVSQNADLEKLPAHVTRLNRDLEIIY